jgi:hypothetical protein
MAHDQHEAAATKSEGWFIPPVIVPLVLMLAVAIYAFVSAH